MATLRERKLNKSGDGDKYQFSVYLNAKEAEAVKAISLAQDINLSSVIVNLLRESLFSEKYQDAIQAYQNFKKSVAVTK